MCSSDLSLFYLPGLSVYIGKIFLILLVVCIGKGKQVLRNTVRRVMLLSTCSFCPVLLLVFFCFIRSVSNAKPHVPNTAQIRYELKRKTGLICAVRFRI